MSERRLRVGAYLSLTGRFGRFGRQAAAGLQALQALRRDIDLVIEDDAGEPRRLTAGLPQLARRCDLLLGPYSTQMMRAASRAVEECSALLWNHGGAGDDVQTAPSGRVISVLTPAGRYAEPFLELIAGEGGVRTVWIVQGRGSFGRQAAAGAEARARDLGLLAERYRPNDPLPDAAEWRRWDAFSAGTFEDDVAVIRRLHEGARRPRTMCAVAAGVADFAAEVADRDGIYGIAQWFRGAAAAPRLGPSEDEFLSAYGAVAQGEPDYPAIQAAAAAAIAVHCARMAGSVSPDDLRAVAAGLDTDTLFGPFRVDEAGRQTRHRTVLVRWAEGRLTRAA